MAKKKRSWKFWVGRILLFIVVIGVIWIVNLIWFRPFNIEHFYEKIFAELALSSPETTTALGLPIVYDWSKDELDDNSDSKLWENHEKLKKDYKTLLSYDFEDQSPENQLNTEILSYYFDINVIEHEPFFYHGYPVNQMEGIQSSLPSLLVSSHKLRDKSDIEAYISRLNQFDVKFSQLIKNLKIRESKNIIPPKYIISMVLEEMNGFVGNLTDSISNANNTSAAKSNILFTNFETKIDELDDISKDDKAAYKSEVIKSLETTVFPAYEKLISYFEKLRSVATNDAGVWKFPDGEAYYRHLLKRRTTTDISPEEIHQLGLSEVARLKKEMFEILESEGYADSTKTLGEIIQKINTEDRFNYPNTDEGREMILARYEEILEEISGGLDEAFNFRPKAGLEVKRTPEFKEEGIVAAYYEAPAMDDSRGGVFYVNLRNVKESTKFKMKTLAYHEGIPGHHFQIALQNELTGTPTFRRVIPFSAYVEGWALYAEQLAYELGFYENDVYGNLGRLQAEMWRAVRLVVDSGIHYKKWTREEAIEYMVENTGISTSEVTTEVERYIVVPGQACAYKIGMIKILELRERAKEKLGNKFDLREFHRVILKNGAVPLDILEEIVETYINDTV